MVGNSSWLQVVVDVFFVANESRAFGGLRGYDLLGASIQKNQQGVFWC